MPARSDIFKDVTNKPPLPLKQIQQKNLGESLLNRVKKQPNHICYYDIDFKDSSKIEKATWKEFQADVLRFSAALVQAGLKKGDTIAISGPTKPKWSVSDYGAMILGVRTVGIYPALTQQQIGHILINADSALCVLEEIVEARKIIQASIDNGEKNFVKQFVTWDVKLCEQLKKEFPNSPIVDWDTFNKIEPLTEEEARKYVGAVEPSDDAILIYTSGTTGPSKGVTLSHGAVIEQMKSVGTVFVGIKENDLSLSYLPCAHVAERVLGLYFRSYVGITTAYAGSIRTIIRDTEIVRPTIISGVPRIFEKAYEKIYATIGAASYVPQQLAYWAIGAGLYKVQLEQKGQPVSWWASLQYSIADSLVLKKIREKFLGGNLTQFFVGAAPVSKEVLNFFSALSLPVYEIYGQSEACCLLNMNHSGAVKQGTVGKPLKGCQQKIADDGEILVKAPWLMDRYNKMPEKTKATFTEDGWLMTGDIGKIDKEGYLTITGRKKHLIITAGGKNISPEHIETAIRQSSPLISHCHAHGDRRKFISALVAVSPPECIAFALQKNIIDLPTGQKFSKQLEKNPFLYTPELMQVMKKITANPTFQAEIAGAVRLGNNKLANVEKVKRIYLLERDLYREEDELTMTLKVKRNNLEKKYKAPLETLYDGSALSGQRLNIQ